MVFSLDDTVERPVIVLNEIFEGCSALLDTGALIPVWTKDAQILKKVYNADLIKTNCKFNGFSNNDIIGDLYKIDLVLGELVFPKLPIIASYNEKIPGFFLFPATMFTQMDYCIKNSTKKLELIPTNNQKCFNIVIGDMVLTQN